MKTYKKVTRDQVYKRSLAQEKHFAKHEAFLLYKAGECFENWSAKIHIRYPKDGAGRVYGYMRINGSINHPCSSPLLPREELQDPCCEGDRVYIVTASCSGYGYCKTSTVLSSLFEQVKFPNVLPRWNPGVSGAGVSTVERQLRDVHGFYLVRV